MKEKLSVLVSQDGSHDYGLLSQAQGCSSDEHKASERRVSIVDGSIETVPEAHSQAASSKLEPVFAAVVMQMLTLEGAEDVTKKVLVGYKEVQDE